MPTYEYHCPRCGPFERQQRITEPALRRCPRCSGKVTRLVSATTFVLKGSGWPGKEVRR
jgi:putative FmdB family regulatory protein